MRNLKIVVLALVASLVVVAPASAHIGGGQARNYAGRYAMRHWNPVVLLPSDSLATSWDGVNSDSCIRFGSNNVHCVVSVNAQDYTDDGFGDLTGYAWCDGIVIVKKHFGSLYARSTDLSCDSTDDTSNGFDLAPN